MLTQARLKELLSYDPGTGKFIWLERRGSITAGSEAGHLGSLGYVVIRIDRKPYKAHRLAWLYLTGTMPEVEIDHIDRNGANNRFANLREATRLQNSANRSVQSNNCLGVKGVRRKIGRKSKPYEARIKVGDGERFLGYFSTVAEASSVYEAAARQHFGDFANG